MSVDTPTPEEPHRKRVQTNKGFGQSVAFSAGRGALLIGIAIVIGIVLLQTVDNPSPSVGDGGGGGSGTETTVTSDDTTGDTTATTAASPSARPPAEVTVQVLNGSGVQGAAGAVTTQLQALGYATLEATDTSSAEGDIVYCSGGLDAEAAALAAAVGGDPPPTTEAMPDPRPSGADADANCIVVLGASA